MRNRIANSDNRFQGNFHRVLTVCSAGLLRSPTAAWILSNAPFNFNTRAAGIVAEYALIPVDIALLCWADSVVVMSEEQKDAILGMINSPIGQGLNFKCKDNIHVLNVPDNFSYRDPDLVEVMTDKLSKIEW